MARYHNIDSLEVASAAVLTAFCAALAERMVGVYVALVDEEEARWAKNSLTAVWEAVAAESDSDACAEALEAINERADSEVEDDLGSAFYAARALDVLGLALESTLRPDLRKAELAANTVESVLGSFDFTLSRERAVILRAGDSLPRPGPLVSREQEADSAFVGLLQDVGLGVDSAVIPAGVILEMRNYSRELGSVYGLAALDVVSADQ